MGSKVQAYQCDVTKRNLVSQLASEVRRDFGDIDILVNNAGIFNGKELLNLTEGEIRRAVDVDVISMFWVSMKLYTMKSHYKAIQYYHRDVIEWKYFPCYWPFGGQ